MAKKSISDFSTETVNAAQEFIKLQNRETHPDGTFDKKKRFYLAETHECCKGIRTPSARWPFSQMIHGRTAQHVAHSHSVEVTELRKAANLLKKQS